MNDVTNADNGKGGTSAANNREYGGTVSNDGKVTAADPGPVANPETDSHAHIDISTDDNDRAQFHSHPSGNVEVSSPVDPNTVNTSVTTTTYQFTQPPSSTDVNNIGNQTGYVFGKGSNNIYIYNNTGVVATMPVKALNQ